MDGKTYEVRIYGFNQPNQPRGGLLYSIVVKNAASREDAIYRGVASWKGSLASFMPNASPIVASDGWRADIGHVYDLDGLKLSDRITITTEPARKVSTGCTFTT